MATLTWLTGPLNLNTSWNPAQLPGKSDTATFGKSGPLTGTLSVQTANFTSGAFDLTGNITSNTFQIFTGVTFNVLNGGKVNTVSLNAGSGGTAATTVHLTGGEVNTTGNEFISAALTKLTWEIEAGAIHVTGAFRCIGSFGDDGGSAEYDQTGGTSTTANEIVGYGGIGFLDITGGTHTVVQNLHVGSDVFGRAGHGTVTMGGDQNAQLTAGNIILASGFIGSTGTFDFCTDPGDDADLSAGIIYCGDNGIGIWNQGGGTTNANLELGYEAAGTGTVNFGGGTINSTFQTVGDKGLGIFNQLGGFNSAGILLFGDKANSIGKYNQTGGTLIADNVIGGNLGGGLFQQNSVVTVTNSVILGNQAGSSFQWDFGDNASLTADSLTVANGGSATVNLDSGSTLDIHHGVVFAAGKTAIAQLEQLANSTITAESAIIGDGGGAVFNQGGTTTISGNLIIANKAGSTGTLNQSDGATLDVQDMFVGYDGVADVELHGKLSVGAMTLAAKAGTASMRVDGQLNIALDAIIGAGGEAEYIQDGGTSTFNALTLGQDATSSGTVKLSGGTIKTIGEETVGQNGDASVEQTGGTNKAYDVFLAKYQFVSLAEYLLENGELKVENHMQVGGEGTATFTMSGGTASVGNTFSIGTLGQATISNGVTFDVGSTVNMIGDAVLNAPTGFVNIGTGSNPLNPGIFIGAGGTLAGSGTINGNLFLGNGGLVSVGDPTNGDAAAILRVIGTMSGEGQVDIGAHGTLEIDDIPDDGSPFASDIRFNFDSTFRIVSGFELAFQHIGILSLEFHVDKLSRPLL